MGEARKEKCGKDMVMDYFSLRIFNTLHVSGDHQA